MESQIKRHDMHTCEIEFQTIIVYYQELDLLTQVA